MAIETNQVVTITYEVTSEGSVIDSNVGKEPLQFTFGVGQIIPGLETRMAHMNIGDKEEIAVPADEAYGQHNPDAVQTVPKAELPSVEEIVPGMQLRGQQPDGTPVQAVVTAVEGDSVTIDFNHPLAGKDLNFSITVLNIQ